MSHDAFPGLMTNYLTTKINQYWKPGLYIITVLVKSSFTYFCISPEVWCNVQANYIFCSLYYIADHSDISTFLL